jgi:plastocyanin
METTIDRRRAHVRQPLAALGKVTVAALAGIALMGAYAQISIVGAFDPALAIFALVCLLVAGGVAAGWRWSPLLGTLWCILIFALNAKGIVESFTQPTSTWFSLNVVVQSLVVVGIVGGIAATLQNYRSAERRTPGWLAPGLTALTGLALGAIAVAALAQQGTTTGISPAALVGFPTLTTKNFAFDQTEIRATVGEAVVLRLTNGDAEMHYFDIDELNVHAPIPTDTDGVALFQPTHPGTYTFYCHPHADKATGQGMVGTLVVVP